MIYRQSVADYAATLPGRCKHGFHPERQPGLCTKCPPAPTDEWSLFLAALRQAVRDDSTVHASDMRRLIRGRIEPKHVGLCWRRARREGLVVEIGHERSDDERGKNAGRMEPYYRLREAS